MEKFALSQDLRDMQYIHRSAKSLDDRRVRSALTHYREDSLRELLNFSIFKKDADLEKIREDTIWEKCSRLNTTARRVTMKNKSERQQLKVTNLALDRQLARNLRQIELEKSELTDWWQSKVNRRPKLAYF